MRVAMLSCNTGEGHNSTANAVREVLEQRGVECEMLDVLACLSEKFSKFVCNWHTRIYRYGPKLFDVGYRAAETSESEPNETTPIYELLSLGAKKLKVWLEEGHFDVILCVHVFSGMMMTEVRRNWDIRTPSFFVATDYTCSPYAGRSDMDGYFIPSADLAYEFIDAGIPARKLIPTGIPVRQAFYHRSDRTQARRKLHLPENGLMLVMMCGSMGCGPMEDIAQAMVHQLPRDAFIVAICGRNEKLAERLSELADRRLFVVGYTKEVPDYMDAADLILTKPGGLSSTEAANKHLPMVFINAVGGCESRNFNFYLSHGYAIGSSDADEVLDQAVMLLKIPAQLERMRRTLEADFTRNTAELIADHLMEAGKKQEI